MPATRNWCWIAVTCVCLLAPATSAAQAIDPVLRADIERLLDLDQMEAEESNAVKSFLDQMADAMRRMGPGVTERHVAVARAAMAAEFEKAFAPSGSLRSAMLDLYARYFNREDIRRIVEFYQSETGKKVRGVSFFQDASKVTQDWIVANAPRFSAVVQERLRTEGLSPLPQ